jgi:SH3-like domain-containing protein
MPIKLNQTLIFIFIYLIPSISFSGEIYLSLKKNKVNVRYGPSFDSPIKFVYKKKNLPIKQIDKKENFRRIIDLKNNSGWIHVSQLKKVNSLIPLENKILFKKPSNFSKPIFIVEKGRVLVIKDCDHDWCQVQSENVTGWIKADKVWGTIN